MKKVLIVLIIILILIGFGCVGYWYFYVDGNAYVGIYYNEDSKSVIELKKDGSVVNTYMDCTWSVDSKDVVILDCVYPTASYDNGKVEIITDEGTVEARFVDDGFFLGNSFYEKK